MPQDLPRPTSSLVRWSFGLCILLDLFPIEPDIQFGLMAWGNVGLVVLVRAVFGFIVLFPLCLHAQRMKQTGQRWTWDEKAGMFFVCIIQGAWYCVVGRFVWMAYV